MMAICLYYKNKLKPTFFLLDCDILLGTKIFCYGGAINGSIDTTLYSLDLSSFTTDSQGNNKTLDQLSAQWTPVTAFNNYVLEGRRTANSVSFNNNTLLIQGGLSYGKLANVTIAYHADSNTWETLPAYTVAAANSEQKQVCVVSSIFIIAFFTPVLTF